jgi:hypothetical protein
LEEASLNWIVQLADVFGLRQTPWVMRIYMLGAVIGSLSMASQAKWGGGQTAGDKPEDKTAE